jgi:SSS family solute:Na+ symporter
MRTGYVLTILCYIALLLVVSSLVARRRPASSEGYLVASRRLPAPLVSVLVAGTWTGGVSIVGMAQGSYIHGISALWFQAGMWIAMSVTALLLPRILTGGKTYSILDVVDELYGRNTARLAGLLQLIFSVWSVTMQVVGGGAILSYLLHGTINFTAGMCLTALVFIIYNMMGGLTVTAYTNVIHLSITAIGIILGASYAIARFPTFGQVVGSHYFAPFGDLGPAQVLGLAYVNCTVGILAQPVINIASSARSTRSARLGIATAVLVNIPIVVMVALSGIVAKSAFPDLPSLSALPALLGVVPPFVSVLLLLGMWAPLMCAGSPFLMGATTLVVKGFITPAYRFKSDRGLLLVSRLTTLGLGLVALVLGFLVKEILRETAWIAVLGAAIVYIVFFGWVRRIAPGWAMASLLGAPVLLAVTPFTGLDRVMHPVWPVTVLVFVLMGAGFLFSRKTRVKDCDDPCPADPVGGQGP